MEIFTNLKNKWENHLIGQQVSPKIAKQFGAIASRCSDGGVCHSHPQHHSKGDCQGCDRWCKLRSEHGSQSAIAQSAMGVGIATGTGVSGSVSFTPKA